MWLINLDYYILGELITCVLSLILCFNVFINFSLLDRRQRIFGYAGVTSFCSAFFDICAVVCITYYKNIPLIFGTIASTFYFLNLMAIPFFMTCYVFDVAFSLKIKTKKIFIFIAVLEYLFFALLIFINLGTGIIFRYDSELGYVRGPLKYMTYIITYIFSMEIIISVLINRKFIAKRIFYVFVIYPFISLIFVIIQMFNNKILLSGVSSFSALLFAYLTIQSNMIEYDYGTGLLTESKLRTYISSENHSGVLYIISIDNMNELQSNMDVSDLNNVLLKIGNEFSSRFQSYSYHISTSRFGAIGSNIEEVKKKADEIENVIRNLNKNPDFSITNQLEIYSAAINFDKKNSSYNSLMDVINIMLVKAKANNNKSLQLCDENVFVDLELKKNIYNILKRELTPESSKYQIWFQPIYSIKERKFTHCEALSRLMNTEIGNIPPSDFIYIAETKGLIDRLGVLAFERVCKFIAENKNTINLVSVNFSANQMLKPDIFENVMEIINKYNISTSNIIVEITESIFIEDFEIVKQNMIKLSNAGIEFYLDDFGTGFSNLANVVGLPFSTIKMDRTFVLMMEEGKKAISLFKNLVSTFKDTKMKVLVEGVETEVQNQFVADSGIDFIQGYLYSKPLSPDKCLEFLSKNNRT